MPNSFTHLEKHPTSTNQPSEQQPNCLRNGLAQTPRHWLLDWEPGRDYLKAYLRLLMPRTWIPSLGRAEAFEMDLNILVDVLGLRTLPQPQTRRAQRDLQWKLFKSVLVLQWYGFEAGHPLCARIRC